MNPNKRKRLEAKGWAVGSADDFLNLSKAESDFIEMKLALSTALSEQRRHSRMTQAELAKRLKTSQSRIAKMEKGDPSVTVDLLIRSLLTLDVPKKQLAEIIS
jgi:DNA-binding XRE family transcriptional regulator